MKGKKIVSMLLALLLLSSLPMSARAAEYDIGNGDITVNAGSGGQTVTQGSQVDIPDSAPVITGSSTENTVTIHAEKDQTANVTLSDVNIDMGGKHHKAAVSTTGDGNVSIELNGDNKLRSGQDHAGLEKKNGGSLTIADEDKNGKLTAEGGRSGAGIGGGYQGNGDDIAITGGEVEATGGEGGAGIGGGNEGDGSNIAITGGEVKAEGGLGGAGIGGGIEGTGSNIAITGGEVTATGGDYGAGIGGGGSSANGSPIPGAEVAPDTSGLTTGRIEYYAPGADMEKDKPTSTFPPQEKPGKPTEPGKPTKLAVPEQPEAERSMDAPLYFVTGRDGRAVRFRAERKDGVLTVTVDEDFAVLTASLSGMTALRAQGVEKIIFVTNGAKNAVKLSTIISRLTANGLLRLTHYGKAVTFTIDGWRLLRYCHCQFASTEQFRQPLPKLRCQPFPFPYILRKIGKSIIL